MIGVEAPPPRLDPSSFMSLTFRRQFFLPSPLQRKTPFDLEGRPSAHPPSLVRFRTQSFPLAFDRIIPKGKPHYLWTCCPPKNNAIFFSSPIYGPIYIY